MVNKEKIIERIQVKLDKANYIEKLKKEVKDYHGTGFYFKPVINLDNVDKFDHVSGKDLSMLKVFAKGRDLKILSCPVSKRKDMLQKIDECIAHSKSNDNGYLPEMRQLSSILKKKDTSIVVNKDNWLNAHYIITNDSLILKEEEEYCIYYESHDKYISTHLVEREKNISSFIRKFFLFNKRRYAFQKYLIKNDSFTGAKFKPVILENRLFKNISSRKEITNIPDFVKDYLLLA